MRRRSFVEGVLGGLASLSSPFGLEGNSGRSAVVKDAAGDASGANQVAQHDIVYLNPAANGEEGLPIGNGDLAAMLWMPPGGLELAINKSNLWDDQPQGYPADWHWNAAWDEKSTSLVSGAHLVIRNGTPLIDPLYLDDFQARLRIYEAMASVDSASPLGKVQAAAWGSAEAEVLVVNYNEQAAQTVSREIELSRWGSRRFFHWYSQYDAGATGTGLDGTQAGADQEHVWIEQKLREISFAVVARFVEADFKTEVRNSHVAVIVTERAAQLRGQVYVAIVTSEEDASPLRAARRKVDDAVAKGYEALLTRHCERWATFWAKSYIQIPEDYLENLYYFSLYQLAASSQGSYPPPFCGGLWTPNHDVRRWGHYFHWDQQQQYWPAHASNHPELALPYLAYRFSGLPEAEKDARELYKRGGGAFYSDVANRRGQQILVGETVIHNITPGTQIAMDFWRNYLYTQDREFLRLRAYPVMKACAQFYLETLEKDAGGTYHVPESTGYENHILQRDAISDLASIRQSFAACIQASEILNADLELRKRWNEVLKNLVDFHILEDAEDEDGRKLPKVFSSGIPLEDSYSGPDKYWNTKIKRSIKKGERAFNISFFCELAPVFPSGVIGLGERGSELFEAARNTVRELDHGPFFNATPTIASARLGMGEHALRTLTLLVENWQLFPQGFFADHLPDYSANRWEVNRVAVIRDGKRTEQRAELPNRWFDRPTFEPSGALMTTLNEMLLQSHDGVIRLFPAMPESWKDAAFRLAAVGGFVVTGERRGGEIQPFTVESASGGLCRAENPWPRDHVSVRELS